jgi:hypothetical protein
MAKKDQKNINKKEDKIVKNTRDNECPLKQGDNCLVPGAFNDSDPIGGG